MRHVAGILIGLVLAAAGLAAAGYGTQELQSALFGEDDTHRVVGIVGLAVGGLLWGLAAAMRRLSPLTTAVAGLGLLGVGLLGALEPSELLSRTRDWDDVGSGLSVLGVSGALIAVGVLLLVLSLVPQGRRGSGSAPTYGQSTTSGPGGPSYGAPSYGAPAYDAPGYGGSSAAQPAYGQPAHGGSSYGGSSYGSPGQGSDRDDGPPSYGAPTRQI